MMNLCYNCNWKKMGTIYQGCFDRGIHRGKFSYYLLSEWERNSSYYNTAIRSLDCCYFKVLINVVQGNNDHLIFTKTHSFSDKKSAFKFFLRSKPGCTYLVLYRLFSPSIVLQSAANNSFTKQPLRADTKVSYS